MRVGGSAGGPLDSSCGQCAVCEKRRADMQELLRNAVYKLCVLLSTELLSFQQDAKAARTHA